jgi:hypothetical protein
MGCPASEPVLSFSLFTACGAFQRWADTPSSRMEPPTGSLPAEFFSDQCNGANMGEVIRFIPKSGRDRARLIREARVIYESLFPSAGPACEQHDQAGVSHTVRGANAHRGDRGLLS